MMIPTFPNRFRFLSLLIAVTFPCIAFGQEPTPEPGQPGAAQEEVAEGAIPAATGPVDVTPILNNRSFVRINSTVQSPDYLRPWQKKAPGSRRGVGVVISDGRILTTAEILANRSDVELEKADTGAKIPAEVVLIDYESNLAILRPENADFLAGMEAVELEPVNRLGESLSVIQFDPNGQLSSTKGNITAVQVVSYPYDDLAFLAYRLNVSLLPQDGSFTMPVLRGERLAGIMMRYDQRTQTADVIPAPVIQHFLTGVEAGDYRGFPSAGFAFAAMRDPQFRSYAGLPEGRQGVYVTEVLRDSPAAKAGLQRGDVLVSIADIAVDADGNYEDPLYGKVAISNLLGTRYYAGDEVEFEIYREGKLMPMKVVLEHRDPSTRPIRPVVLDETPPYLMVGGLVFQPLTRQLLKEWGRDWVGRAPQRLVYYDQFQDDLFDKDKKGLVIMTSVIPTPGTIGYENLGFLVVTEVNGKPVETMEELAEAFATPDGEFHRIRFEESPKEIFVDAALASQINAEIRKSYGLPDRNF